MLGLSLALLCAPAIAAASSPAEPVAASTATLRRLLEQPEGSIDLARAKVTIDYLVDPKTDVEGTLRQLDQWAAKVRARFPAGASNKVKMDLLISTLYQPGPWNDHRPFSYDYTDPFGK